MLPSPYFFESMLLRTLLFSYIALPITFSLLLRLSYNFELRTTSTSIFLLLHISYLFVLPCQPCEKHNVPNYMRGSDCDSLACVLDSATTSKTFLPLPFSQFSESSTTSWYSSLLRVASRQRAHTYIVGALDKKTVCDSQLCVSCSLGLSHYFVLLTILCFSSLLRGFRDMERVFPSGRRSE